MSPEGSTRVYPVPEPETSGTGLGERTNQAEIGARPQLAKAEIPIHKSASCGGLCGLSSREPEDYATVYIASQTDIARALQVKPPVLAVSCRLQVIT